jgi:hypothetical protein
MGITTTAGPGSTIIATPTASTMPPTAATPTFRALRLAALGSVESLRQRFYAISAERKIKNPAVVAICEGARKDIFAAPSLARRGGRARA